MDAPLSWLPDATVESVRCALRCVAPELAARPMDYRPRVTTGDARYWQGSALVDGSVIVKFAWAPSPARRIVHEAAVLRVLAQGPMRDRVPDVVFASTGPALLGTRRVRGMPLAPWDVDALDAARRRRLVTDLGGSLAGLHRPVSLAGIRRAGIALAPPEPQAATDTLRARFTRLVDADRAALVEAWCDGTDAVLARTPPPEPTLLHADLHGFNLVWDPGDGGLRLVADWETAALGDPAYDFNALPAQAASVDFFLEVAAAYERDGGGRVDTDRVMAWHMRTALGDALWRTEAGIELPGGGTASSWVDDVAGRMARPVPPLTRPDALSRPPSPSRRRPSPRRGPGPPSCPPT